ncbi:DUF2452 domain-containing protein [Aquimarina sp. W85]|uniref:DUF2452 domain-containing protein n=1 Tax=Aquimarina rhodophyticola TaxID=3342246 RepID=UPI0036721121
MANKKPDAVVFNDQEQRYDAGLKAYATNVSAPAITIEDTAAWKNRGITNVNHQIKTKFDELKLAYEQLMDQFEYNNLIYQSKFNFEPVIGATYYLYKRKNEETFLSVISPEECNFTYIGTFQLKADRMWEKL